MALAAAGNNDLLRESVINSALADIHLPGRAQIVADRFVLDVAHNPDAAAMLATTVKDIRSGRAAVTILGMLNDKDVEAVVNALDGLTDHWIAVTTDSPRAIAADELSQRIQVVTNRPCRRSPSMAAAIAHAAELSDGDETILITGSFYTVGAALVILAAAGDEHG